MNQAQQAGAVVPEVPTPSAVAAPK
jgi:hypothetical protein